MFFMRWCALYGWTCLVSSPSSLSLVSFSPPPPTGHPNPPPPSEGGAAGGGADGPSQDGPGSMLVMSGGEGYIDFRMGEEGEGLRGHMTELHLNQEDT